MFWNVLQHICSRSIKMSVVHREYMLTCITHMCDIPSIRSNQTTIYVHWRTYMLYLFEPYTCDDDHICYANNRIYVSLQHICSTCSNCIRAAMTIYVMQTIAYMFHYSICVRVKRTYMCFSAHIFPTVKTVYARHRVYMLY